MDTVGLWLLQQPCGGAGAFWKPGPCCQSRHSMQWKRVGGGSRALQVGVVSGGAINGVRAGSRGEGSCRRRTVNRAVSGAGAEPVLQTPCKAASCLLAGPGVPLHSLFAWLPAAFQLASSAAGLHLLFTGLPGRGPKRGRAGRVRAQATPSGHELYPNGGQKAGFEAAIDRFMRTALDRRRRMTNVVLALNVVCYLASVLSGGQLSFWGAKINEFISAGQYWRLLTPAVLHAGFMHLAVNSYSLHNVGPAWEGVAGRPRFLAVYAGAALAGNIASFFCSKNPAVGASGAIFGLIGAMGVFFLRHQEILGEGGKQSLKSIGSTVVLNLALGSSVHWIDNYGHIGGLMGGAALAWFLGPALELQVMPDGTLRGADRPPVQRLFGCSRHASLDET